MSKCHTGFFMHWAEITEILGRMSTSTSSKTQKNKKSVMKTRGKFRGKINAKLPKVEILTQAENTDKRELGPTEGG